MIILGIILHCIAFIWLFSRLEKLEDSKFLNLLKSVFPNTKSGNLLYQQTLGINPNNPKSSYQTELIEYKYFTALINELIGNSKKYGTSITSYLPEIKKGLIQDIQMDKKVFSLFLGGIYQFFLVFILGLFFILSMTTQLRVALTSSDILLPVCIQFFGVISFCFCYVFLRNIRFRELFKYLFKIYQIRTLTQAQIPLKEVFRKVNPNELSSKGDLKFFKEKIMILFTDMKNKGYIDSNDLEIYINELWQYIDIHFEKFNKELGAIKLLHLALFSLGGYLLLMLQAFSSISI